MTDSTTKFKNRLKDTLLHAHSGFSYLLDSLPTMGNEVLAILNQDTESLNAIPYVAAVSSVLNGIQQISAGSYATGGMNLGSGGAAIGLTIAGMSGIGLAVAAGTALVLSIQKTVELDYYIMSEKGLESWRQKQGDELTKLDQNNPLHKTKIDEITDKIKQYDGFTSVYSNILHGKSSNTYLINPIRKELKKELTKTYLKNIMYITALMGSILTLIPGGQIPALILIGISLGIYAYLHKDSIKSALTTTAQNTTKTFAAMKQKFGTFFVNNPDKSQQQPATNPQTNDNIFILKQP